MPPTAGSSTAEPQPRFYYDLGSPESYLVAERVLHALGASFVQGPWSLSVEARNLADLRIVDMVLGGTINQGKTTPYPLVDFFDYPLPGRAVYLTASYQR